jgi:hypothetical protein
VCSWLAGRRHLFRGPRSRYRPSRGARRVDGARPHHRGRRRAAGPGAGGAGRVIPAFGMAKAHRPSPVRDGASPQLACFARPVNRARCPWGLRLAPGCSTMSWRLQARRSARCIARRSSSHICRQAGNLEDMRRSGRSDHRAPPCACRIRRSMKAQGRTPATRLPPYRNQAAARSRRSISCTRRSGAPMAGLVWDEAAGPRTSYSRHSDRRLDGWG